MSYFDSLIRQTGMTVGEPPRPPPAEEAAPPFEREEVRLVAPAPTPALTSAADPPRAQVAPAPAPPKPTLPALELEREEPEAPAPPVREVVEARELPPAPEPAPLADEAPAPPPVTHEEVVEAPEVASPDAEDVRTEQVVRTEEVHVDVVPAARAPDHPAEPTPERPTAAQLTPPAPAPAVEEAPQLTSVRYLEKVRRWVAATPAPDEVPVAEEVSAEVVAEPEVQVVERPVRVARSEPGPEAPPVAPPTEQQLNLSIGSIHVTVEEERPAVEPPPQPHPLQRKSTTGRQTGRLRRHYVRM